VNAVAWEPEKVREFVLNGVDGSWLDDGEKTRRRRALSGELDRLEAELER
jgi:hypothetical protein